MAAARHKTVHHLSQKADDTYAADNGWVESIAGLSENSSATALLREHTNGQAMVTTQFLIIPILLNFTNHVLQLMHQTLLSCIARLSQCTTGHVFL